MLWTDDDLPTSLVDYLPLITFWIAIGTVVVRRNLDTFWDHLDARSIARRRRVASGWTVYWSTFAAVLVWPVIFVVVPRTGGERRAHRALRGTR